MPILAHMFGWLAQGPQPGGNSAGGAAVMLGVAVAAAVVLMFVIARTGRRWLMQDPGRRGARDDPRSRVDPWFEAGRRLQPPSDDQEPRS